MSKFSGKCDFYDEIEIYGLDTILNSNVYIGNSDKTLNLTSYKDCIPYFPYIVVSSVYCENLLCLRLSSKSWVDIEEERYGHMSIHDLYRQKLQKEKEHYLNLEE